MRDVLVRWVADMPTDVFAVLALMLLFSIVLAILWLVQSSKPPKVTSHGVRRQVGR